MRRKKRIRHKIHGTSDIPRVSVYRSNKYFYAQVIDDEARKTLASVTTVKSEKEKGRSKADSAREAGKVLATDLLSKNITKVVFDRNRYLYLGRVKNFAEGLREGGVVV